MSRRVRTRLARSALAVAAAALAAGAFVPTRVPDETRTGWMSVVWQTRGVHNELAGVRLYLVDEAGRGTEIAAPAEAVAAEGGLLRLNGRRMTVTGDLVPPRDPQRLGKVLAALLADDARRAAYGAAGVRRARERYRWSRVVADTETVYRQVLARRRPVEVAR